MNVMIFFLFLSLDTSCDLTNKWQQYLQGGVYRNFIIPSNKLHTVFYLFPWKDRIGFKINQDQDQDQIEITVRTLTPENLQFKLEKISDSENMEFAYIDLNTIMDEHEAFGILRVFQEKNIDTRFIIPLIGTSRIYYPAQIQKDLTLTLSEYIPPVLSEGVEIFSQDFSVKCLSGREQV